MPPLVRQALHYVPPAVLSAIIFPELLLPGGQLDLSMGNLRLLAGLLAADRELAAASQSGGKGFEARIVLDTSVMQAPTGHWLCSRHLSHCSV